MTLHCDEGDIEAMRMAADGSIEHYHVRPHPARLDALGGRNRALSLL